MAKSKSESMVQRPKVSKPERPNGSNGSGHRWTFLTNHAHVLIQLHADPHLVLREVADSVGITERAVQRIVHELEEQGFIERHRVGRRNHYRVLPDNYLRHPIESHCKIADLLDLIVGGKSASDQSAEDRQAS